MKRLSKEQHIETAQALRKATTELRVGLREVGVAYPKTHPVSRAKQGVEKALDLLQCRLDSEWHRTINDEEFMQHGSVHYGHTGRVSEKES